nr:MULTISPECIES: hypothetical protein [unclassified Burkholderia]
MRRKFRSHVGGARLNDVAQRRGERAGGRLGGETLLSGHEVMSVMTGNEMHKLFTVRAAHRADADELTRLARLSKAHWGYPKEWLDLWQNDLTISPETIEGAIGYVAESGESMTLPRRVHHS